MTDIIEPNTIGRVEIARKKAAAEYKASARMKFILKAHSQLGSDIVTKIPVVRKVATEIRDELEKDAEANAGRAPEPRGRGSAEKYLGLTSARRHSLKIRGGTRT